MLNREDASRRVAAAIRLAGTTQKELGEALAQDGLGVTDPERIMQKKKTVQSKDAAYLAKHTGLPEAWFLEPDLARVMRPTPNEEGAGAPVQDAELAEALAGLAEVQQQLQRVQELLQPDAPPGEGAGSG